MWRLEARETKDIMEEDTIDCVKSCQVHLVVTILMVSTVRERPEKSQKN